MVAINVDFEVFKELTALRESESVSENDVIRNLLGLGKTNSKNNHKTEKVENNGIPWVCKGVTFPHGTKFKAIYKGQSYAAHVDNGALLLNGKRFTSPSSAAVSITGNPVNGWMFWECLFPNSSNWQLIANLRNN